MLQPHGSEGTQIFALPEIMTVSKEMKKNFSTLKYSRTALVLKQVHASLVAQMIKNPPAIQETWVMAKLIGIGPLVAQLVKNLPAIRETWVRSLGWEDPLEKGKATRSSTLAWRIPCTEEPDRL